MRTRLQEALFFKQYSEERKKKKAAAVNGGDQSKNGDSGARADVNGGDSSSPVSSEQSKSNSVDVGFKEGLGSVIPKEGENLGVKSDGKLREGLEENQGVLIGGERDDIQEVLRKEENVGRVDLKENSESSKRVLEEKNKSVDGVVCGADESDESDDGEVVFLGMECRKEGLRKEENVGRVDLKENCESSRSVEEKNKSLDGVVRGADESDDSDGGVVFLGMERRKESEVGLRKKQKSSENLKKNKNVVETGSGGDDDDVVFLGIDNSRVEIGVDGVVQNGVMGSNCDIDLQGSKEVSESRDAMKSGARGSAELVPDSGYSEESEWSSDEDSEGCSDQDNVGSTDVDSDGSPSCSDYEDEIDEDERSVCNGKGKEKMTEMGSVDRRGKGGMIKVGLKRREKSSDFVYLGRARRDGGIIEGDGGEEMIKVGLKRKREKSPDFVYLGRARRDGGIIEGDGDEEMIKVGLKRRREKSPDFVYLGRARRDGGIIEGDREDEMIKVGLKRREKSPDFVYLGRARRDGGILEGDREEETIKVGLKRREKSPDFVYLGRAHRDGEGQQLKGNDVRKVGLKRRREKSPDFVYLGRARRDGEGEGEKLKGNDVRKEGIVEGDGEQETIEKSGRRRPVGKLNCGVDEEKDGSGGLKRMTYSGLDLLVGCDREKDGKGEDPEEPKSVAERIHLRPRRGNKKELGSFSCPLTLSDKELESSSGDDDGTDSDEDERSDRSAKDSKKVGKSGEKSEGKVGRPPVKRSRDRENGNDANNVWRSHEISKGKVGRPAKRRHGCAGSAAPIRVEKILADSIWQNSDVPEEGSVSFQVPDLEVTLPLKFRFLDEDPIPPEKSSWEIEADKLFAEMDFALAACEIGASDSSMVDSEDSVTEETESDPATSCREGKHQLVLDDEIGLKCKFCPFVKLEIKHILPSFRKHPWGGREKNYWNNSDHCNFENIQFQDSASTSNSKDQICAEGTVWDIIPGIKTSMYPHQREGFEFIWKNIGGSIDLEDLKKHTCEGGSGCIISHAPGTGKTRLAIVFLQTFMELNPKCMPIIVAPRSMLLTWEEEFKKWKVDIPFHNLNQPEFSGREDQAAINLLSKVRHHGLSVNAIRLVKLFSWKMGKSVLGISYRLFEKLAENGIVSGDDNAGGRRRKSKRYAEAEQVRKMLLELPGLLVLDEGHTPRNDQSLMWRALSGVQTQRRILLSGTPFQNNFHELFNTLCLVRPKFSDRIGTGIKGDCRKKGGREGRKGRGKWASLTNSIGKDAGDKLDKLRAIIDPFVHVHKGTILEENLPGLRDALVVLNPTDLQKSLIENFQGRNVFKRDHLASLISVHPSLLLGCALSEEEGLSVNTNELETLRFDPRAGAKTHFLMELIRLSMAVKEKVLVFSQFLEPLAFIREQLKSSFGWTEGKDLLYMDGQIEAKHRQSSISLLNDPGSQVQVLLASTRACCEGISLVGASRVVLLDVVWNPAVERQAISRAYRIGQKKVVYIYRLIMSGTMEGEKCVRQVEKDRLSELVFSSAEGKDHGAEIISRAVNDDKILQEMVQHEKISYMFSKILDQPKVSNLVDIFG